MILVLTVESTIVVATKLVSVFLGSVTVATCAAVVLVEMLEVVKLCIMSVLCCVLIHSCYINTLTVIVFVTVFVLIERNDEQYDVAHDAEVKYDDKKLTPLQIAADSMASTLSGEAKTDEHKPTRLMTKKKRILWNRNSMR